MSEKDQAKFQPVSSQILGMERAKERRRDAIFAAAETMIRQSGGTDFSMNELARSASVSTYTIYNLIGGKDAVFYTLLNRAIDQIRSTRLSLFAGDDALSTLFGAADSAVGAFVTDAEFYRPLMRHLLGVPDPTNRPRFMAKAFDFWWEAIAPLADNDFFKNSASIPAVTRSIQIFFTGITDYWVHGEVSDCEFRGHVRYGIASFLLAAGKETGLAGLASVMGDSMAVIEAAVDRSR